MGYFLLSRNHGTKACFGHSDFVIQTVCEGADVCSHIAGLVLQDRKLN